jgi:hypothetical protein
MIVVGPNTKRLSCDIPKTLPKGSNRRSKTALGYA